MIGAINKIDINEAPDKVKLFVFFPLAKVDDLEMTDEQLCIKNAMKNFKQIEYTVDDIKSVVEKFKNYIKESDQFDWDNNINESSGETSFACSFCDFCGMTKNQDVPGFHGCKATRDKGLFAKRSTKVVQKD